MLNTIATAINCQMNNTYINELSGQQNPYAYDYQGYDYSNYGYSGDTNAEYAQNMYAYDDPNYVSYPHTGDIGSQNYDYQGYGTNYGNHDENKSAFVKEDIKIEENIKYIEVIVKDNKLNVKPRKRIKFIKKLGGRKTKGKINK
jgi:hypothetical protein